MKKDNNVTNATDNAIETVSPDGLITMTYKGFTKDGATDVVLNSSKLIEHTNTINAYIKLGRSAQLGIAYELAKVYKDESFKSSFKNIDDYAATMFNIKHTTTTLYRMVGELFITKTDNNVPVVKDGLPQFSVGQLIELLPLYKGVEVDEGKARLITLLNTGAFGQYSTTKAIRDAVKNSLLIETSATDTTNTSDTVDTTNNDNASETETTADIIAAVKGYLETLNVKLEKDNASDDIKSKVLSIMASVDELNQLLR